MIRDTMGEKHLRLTQEPVEGLVVKLAVPAIATMLISACYNMADTYFVASLGTPAIAAVGISFSLMAFIQAVGFFFGHGAGNHIARELGAKRRDNASRMAATGFVTAFVLTGAFSLAALANLDSFARLLGSTDTILPYARDYLAYILLGAPFIASCFCLNTILRFQGSATYGMLGMAAGALLNIVLDPILIFGFDMGVKGAAVATMASQMAGFAILLIGSARRGNIAIRLGEVAPSVAAYREMVRGGLPSLCRQGLASVAAVCLNQTAAAYGDAAIAALSVVQRIVMFAGSALIGFGQGFQPVCGFNFGAGLHHRVRAAFRFCVRTSFGALVALAVPGFVFAPSIIAVFRPDDQDVISIGGLALRMQCVAFPLMGWVILNNMMMQTIGRAAPATVLALARHGLFMLPLLFILPPRFGVLGLQLAQPTADLLTFALSVPLGLRVLRSLPEGAVPDGVGVGGDGDAFALEAPGEEGGLA